jgi:bifunctional UDP-N-acetylglucosamine pyrophosphorylase/glucosamine-1-phosphate N-acetyltransferase
MIDFVIDAVEATTPEQVVVVLSPQLNANNDLIAHLQNRLADRLGIAIQHETLGTGDALRRAEPLVHDVNRVAVVFADHPLLEAQSVTKLVGTLDNPDTSLALLTCQLDGGGAYGRIHRSPDGTIERIVERKDDDPKYRDGQVEVNTGMMAIDRAWLSTAVSRLTPSPVTGEFYLTQLPEIAASDGRGMKSITGTTRDLTGVNDRTDLAHAEDALQVALKRSLQESGVTLRNPGSITIEWGVSIDQDVVIEPGSILRAGTSIGSGSVIGPNSVLDRATIGKGCRIVASYVTDSEFADNTDIGPFGHVRGGSYIATGAHIGNFAEVKNSRIGEDVRMGHFSYVGDASVGERTNIGAGVVTCNFDGEHKNESLIGNDVFLGSDTMLIAPVRVGDGAVTGAGSVVTKDVARGDRVAGVPARPIGVKRERQSDS